MGSLEQLYYNYWVVCWAQEKRRFPIKIPCVTLYWTSAQCCDKDIQYHGDVRYLFSPNAPSTHVQHYQKFFALNL